MSIPTSPTFFTVTADFKAFVADTAEDLGIDPDSQPITGLVTFRPTLAAGDLVLATHALPRPTGYIAAPITAIIDTDGQLKLRSDGTAVRLLADTAFLELSGPLYYQVTFDKIKYGSQSAAITGFTFQAPDHDTTINLISVARKPGVPSAAGITKIAPGAVRLTGDNMLQFSFGGVDIPDPLPLLVDFTAEQITDSGAVGRDVIRSATAAAARDALGVPRLIDVAGEPYNVTPSTTNPEVVIQQALDYAHANGIPEVVISRPGTYTIGGLRRVDGQVGGMVMAALWGYSNLKLTMKPGVVLKLCDNIALPADAQRCSIISVTAPYSTSAGGIKTNWVIEGGVIDGNAQNQTGIVCYEGIFLGVCRNSWVKDVTVRNLFGNGSSFPGETVHFSANGCQDVAFINCVADGSGSTETATGFSSDNSFGVTWTGCTSLGMGYGMGFTNWQCSDLQYANCRAYSNSVGFNNELSNYVTYTGCVSGGQSPTLADNVLSPHFPAGTVNVGNKIGWYIRGCNTLTVSGCIASHNTTTNIKIGTHLTDDVICQRVLVTGSVISGCSPAVSIETLAQGGLNQTEIQFIGNAVLDGGILGANWLQIYTEADSGTPGIYPHGIDNLSMALGTKGTGSVFLHAEPGQDSRLSAASESTSNHLVLSGHGPDGTVKIGSAAALYSGGALGTPASGTLTHCSGLPVAGIVGDAATAVGVGTLEVGHASDTTLARSAAGVLSVEGVDLTTKSVVSLNTSGTLLSVAGRTYVYVLGASAVPTLPTAVGNTSVYHLKATSGLVTVATTSSQTIDGMAGNLQINPYECYTLVSDGANWVII